MTLLYSDARFLDHQTGGHPESAGRLAAVTRHLVGIGLDRQCTCPDWEPVAAERLARVHAPTYTAQLRQFTAAGGGHLDADTVVGTRSYDVALLAAGAVCDAVDRTLRGGARQALCLVRPPGHHALRAHAMGFCLLNHVAVAARVAIDEWGLERVLIIDWDVHHGNGTQATFWQDPRVGYFSIHRWPFYPGSGARDETGSGAGLGTVRNVPIAMGTSRTDYRAQFDRELGDFAAAIRPELVFLSAGFDSHRADPIGSLGLETEDFSHLTATACELAAAYAAGRVVSVLEGGYNPPALADCVALHLRALMRHDPA
jgi:acetoin utilization deacetylase AcuC-like enzyme